MNKILSIFIIVFFWVQNLFCQDLIKDISDYEVIYNLQYQKDSLDLNSKQNEKMTLLIGKDYSLFESINNKYNDSLKRSLVENYSDISLAVSQSIKLRKKSRFKFRILKSDNETLVFDSYFSDKFIYQEKEELKWVLTKTTDTISGFNCNLALTTFAGRKYKAWFTSEIPISDGPYKFKGLPGLIVKIEDERKHYVFQLESFESEKQEFEFDTKAGTEVDKKGFYKSYSLFKKNFIAQLSHRGIEFDKSTSRNTKKRVQKSRNNEIEISY